jgi:hypothetical protein
MAYIMSTTRIIKASTLPPRKPAVAPHTMPMVHEASVASRPTMSDIRPPIRQRTSRSRPASSVPQKWLFFQVGATLMASQSALSNEWGSTNGPMAQANVTSASTSRLITAARLRRNRARASAQRPRPLGASAGEIDGACVKASTSPSLRRVILAPQ